MEKMATLALGVSTCLECALRLPLGLNSRHVKAHTMGEDCDLSSRARALSLSLCFFLSERKGRSERERGRGSERGRHKEHKSERERESRSDGETESLSACASYLKNCFCPFWSVNMRQEYSCVYVCVCTYVSR